MRQPYRDLKVKAKQVRDTAEKLLSERAEANAATPEEAYPLLFEELLEALDMTAKIWAKYRDFSDPLHSPTAFKDMYPDSTDKDYKVYLSLYRQRKDLQEAIQKTEQKLGAGVVKTALLNPKLQTFCIFLTKQRCYGGYADHPDTAAPGDVKICVKLLDDKGRQV